ncbi:MAG: hypothetical protein KC731_42180, partial [Myxococcales bacterium]|nr:hypothetical protein [Myxococcales bacterium]
MRSLAPQIGAWRVSLDALDAPEALVAAARDAELAAQEHAAIASRLAYALVGRASTVPPSPGEVEPVELPLSSLVVAVAREAIDSCLASHLTRAALRRCHEPEVARQLHRIEGHIATRSHFAWATLRWILARGAAGQALLHEAIMTVYRERCEALASGIGRANSS